MSAEINELIAALLDGNRRALARLITHVENESPEAGAILSAIYPKTGGAYLVGITGAPGTGKSTLVNALTQHFREEGHRVGIVAVDPTSPFSQGAILGDRIRMRELSGDPGVFIRSMATRGSLGGLARATTNVVRLMDAAGFDFILIETVGAGQSEVAIAGTAYTTLVVDAPGLGDDIQATKAGILEIADILVVNKADRPGVDHAVRALRAMLDLGHRTQAVIHHGLRLAQSDGGSPPKIDTWNVPVLKTTAAEKGGIPELYAAIIAHKDHLQDSGLRVERERTRLEIELLERLQEALLERLLAKVSAGQIDELLVKMMAREITPLQGVHHLLE